MVRREPAYRVFAAEFNDATKEIRDADRGARSPTYLLSPLGSLMNRLYIVGVLTEVRNAGGERDPLWKARVTDPTGVFFVTAGSYQPEAAKVLAGLEPPLFVAVVGKVNAYRPEEGRILLSLRPELIRTVSRAQRDLWIVEAAEGTLRRIEAIEEASRMSEPSEAELVRLGYPAPIASGVIRAIREYGTTDTSPYRIALRDALLQIVERTEATPERTENAMAAREAYESTSGPDGAARESILSHLIGKGMTEDEAEAALSALLMTGDFYEPRPGLIRPVFE